MTFSDYSNEPNALTFEQMQQIHQEILSEIGNDEDALELYNDLLQKAIRYTKIRADWALMTREERMDADSGRTSAHDSVIIGFNMLARYLKSQGKEAGWRSILGDLDKDPSLRKRIGDMANYLVFIEALSQR